MRNVKIAVVMPSYKSSKTVISVLSAIGPEVSQIFVVDDGCPEGTGQLVEREISDDRVRVIFHEVNLGVGAARVL